MRQRSLRGEMQLSHQTVECPHFCALRGSMMQIRPCATPKNSLSLSGGYEKRVDALLIAPKLLYAAKGYHLIDNCNLGAKNCGFRGCWDTSNRRIPYANRVPVYRSRRMSYQNVCRPWRPVTVNSVSRQKFRSPAHGVTPLVDLDNRDVQREMRRVSL